MVLRQVTFGYAPGRAVVSEVSATLAAGRVTAVIGPNAAGKSTLLKLMLGRVRPWSGGVELGGGSVGAMSERRRACRMAYIPQHGGVRFAFTVRQVVAMGRFAQGDDRGVATAVARCELSGLADRPFVELSGGQQQRVLLARAMAQLEGGGRVLLADEPVSAMDLRHQARTMRLLGELAGEGVAVAVVVHDLNLAARYADDVWLLHAGRLAASGGWSAVLRREVLEPAYGVALQEVARTAGGRPVLAAEEADRLSSGAAR